MQGFWGLLLGKLDGRAPRLGKQYLRRKLICELSGLRQYHTTNLKVQTLWRKGGILLKQNAAKSREGSYKMTYVHSELPRNRFRIIIFVHNDRSQTVQIDIQMCAYWPNINLNICLLNHSAWKSTKLALKIGEFFHFPMGWEFIKEKKENTQERKHACVHENTQTRTRTRKRPRKHANRHKNTHKNTHSCKKASTQTRTHTRKRPRKKGLAKEETITGKKVTKK